MFPLLTSEPIYPPSKSTLQNDTKFLTNSRQGAELKENTRPRMVHHADTREQEPMSLTLKRKTIEINSKILPGTWLTRGGANPSPALGPPLPSATTLRWIKNSTLSWGYKWQPPSPSSWNITGTYEGSWGLLEYKNGNSRSPKLRKSSGDFVLELISTPTESKGVHNVKGMIMFYKVFDDEHKVGGVQIKVEGVYIWPFKQLRVAYRGKQDNLDVKIMLYPIHITRLDFSHPTIFKSLHGSRFGRGNTHL
ncbi:hypothetical protein POM88_043384 [Heracleum sosnowskyi]|uniref:Uncharacterized protein n=1 Tax=Heracleum sosnowskyi TaxID=360622 RepID=A0AAD8H0Z5_9APIA|nr:hypothetical protein POM88_043384 [Heracleum sosnowskyi]